MNNNTRQMILERINNTMDIKIQHLTTHNPFDPDEVELKNPFGFRLVPLEVWQGSKFERSFVTTLGQGIFEQIAKLIAEDTGSYAENQHRQNVVLNTFQNESIDNIITEQTTSSGRRTRIVAPDLHSELGGLRNLNNRSTTSLDVISDLYVRRPDGREEFYSFKTVKPNIDQTAVAKRNLLALRTCSINYEAYLALPFNPGGDGNLYSRGGHSLPKRLFNMEDEDFVLIGSSLWNKLGDNPNTYNELLQIFEEAGQRSSERIRREYFNIND